MLEGPHHVTISFGTVSCLPGADRARMCFSKLRHAAQVQQEYHALFETSAGDPDAVMRWRNRAMRFVLSSETDPAYAHQADSKRQSSSGSECVCVHTRCTCISTKQSCTTVTHHTSNSSKLGEMSRSTSCIQLYGHATSCCSVQHQLAVHLQWNSVLISSEAQFCYLGASVRAQGSACPNGMWSRAIFGP